MLITGTRDDVIIPKKREEILRYKANLYASYLQRIAFTITPKSTSDRTS